MAITIKKSEKDNTPVVFGLPNMGNDVAVNFGYGTLEKVLERVGTSDDGVIYFGYDEANNTGAIVARGKLVSSKILNIKSTPADISSNGTVNSEATVTISYVDVDKTVKTLNIPVSADAKLKALADRVSILETTVGTKSDLKETDTVFGTIAKEVDRATTAENMLNTRVTNIETIMGDALNADEDSVINKVVEVIDWFKDVNESETGKSLIEDVAHNKAELGTPSDASTAATGIHKRLEDLEAKKHVVSNVTAGDGKYVSGVHVDANGNLTVDSVVLEAKGVAAVAINGSDDTVAVEGDKVDAQIASLAKSVKSVLNAATKAIEGLDVVDSAAEGKYVSAVSQTDGKIKVERTKLPTLSVKAGSENFVAVDNHAVEVKTSTLGSVGLTKDDVSGKWVAGTNDNATGLATSADVAGKLVSDEEVIATALNDHETRLNDIESKSVAVASSTSDVAITVASKTNINDELALNVTGGKTTYTIQFADNEVEEKIDVFNEATIQALAKLYATLEKRVTWIELN